MGEAQPATKGGGDQRSETVAAAPLLQQPLTLSSSALARRVAYPPGNAGEGDAHRGKALGDRSLETSGWTGREEKLSERSRGHSEPAMTCQGTTPVPLPPPRESWILEPITLPPTRSQPPPDRGSIQLLGATNGAGPGSRGRARAETHR